ncbi:type IV toxin-antitoxin system AbiEi family antitoxin domain-containing protein [Kribbella sp. HUAS MG21]|uniref:Type IV toxin-antitoxin system AbiEi family antitoxin domain-containing protein n=1 Tax=Kribbella sp. HUAS MG21 TaxID=3160966 RepID=A0AAU7THF5_9ACTN
MTSVVEVLARLGGWAGAAELVQLTSRRALAAAVRRGDVERLTRGVYALPGIGTDLATAIAYDGVVSHLSAAVAWRLPLLLTPQKPHITLPTNRNARSGPPAVLHWADLPAADHRSRRTSLHRTVLDCARILPFGEALAVADAALATGRISSDELVASAEALSGFGRPNVRRVAGAATGLAESFLESILRGLLIDAGVPGFEPQVLVELGSRRIRVDLGHRAARIALEAEGYEFHGSPTKFTADCRRYDELVVAGWLVLRFTYQQVIGDPQWVVASVVRAAAQRVNVQNNG